MTQTKNQKNKDSKDPPQNVEELKQRLFEAEEVLNAIRRGEVDALVVSGPDKGKVYILENADRTYRTLVEQMPIGALVTDMKGVVIYCNSNFSLMIDLPIEKIIGDSLEKFVSLKSVKKIDALLSGINQGNFQNELDFKKNEICVPVQISAFSLEKFGTQAICVIADDLTYKNIALQESENALRNSEESLRLLLQYAPTAIYEIDFKTQRYKSVNEAMCKMTGYSSQELLLMKPEDLFLGESKKHFKDWIQRNIDGRKDGNFEIKTKTKSGEELWVSLNIKIIYQDGEIDSALIVEHDISESKKAENAKNRFISTLAHELRNPLAPLMSAIQLLDNSLVDNKRSVSKDQQLLIKDVLDTAGRQVRTMARLLDDLLDVSRIVNDKIKLKEEYISIAEILERAVESTRFFIEKSNHKLHLTLPKEVLSLKVDPMRIEQIIVNLLNNAIKFSKPGGNIWLSANRKNNEVVIKVKDDGIGILPHRLSSIFQQSFQAELTEDRTYGGLGVGLMLVKKLCNLQGGKVTAKSKGLGKGSEFIVTFPVLLQPLPLEEPIVSNSNKNRKRILVVDDIDDVARLLAMLLEKCGHEVMKANDGISAIEIAKSFQPEFVFLDIGMPGMDGYQTVKELRKLKCGPKQKMIIAALSGYGQQEDFIKSKKAGFDDHFIKPVSVDKIFEFINSKSN